MDSNFSSLGGAGKTVIITGANGNLGSAVTKEFLNKGYKVVATVITEAMKNDLSLIHI